ncbi:unnamed protein product [Urochloa humidicola]
MRCSGLLADEWRKLDYILLLLRRAGEASSCSCIKRSFNNFFLEDQCIKAGFSWSVRIRKVPRFIFSRGYGAHSFGDFHLPFALTSHHVTYLSDIYQ